MWSRMFLSSTEAVLRIPATKVTLRLICNSYFCTKFCFDLYARSKELVRNFDYIICRELYYHAS